jgi:hypothetical protein
MNTTKEVTRYRIILTNMTNGENFAVNRGMRSGGEEDTREGGAKECEDVREMVEGESEDLGYGCWGDIGDHDGMPVSGESSADCRGHQWLVTVAA